MTDQELGRFDQYSFLFASSLWQFLSLLFAALSEYADISRDQMVICSAWQRWNHDAVLDKLLCFLPPEKRIKASINRDVKSPAEQMSPSARAEILSDRSNSN